MRSSQTYSVGRIDRYSAKKMAKPITFICAAPTAQRVSLVGDFDEWQPNAHPMVRQPDGNWLLQVQLTHGHHRYQFLVDGQPTLDPRAQGIECNENNEKVSLLAVS